MAEVGKREHFFYSYNMIFEQPISEHAKIVYLYLCRCSDSKAKSFPSFKKIAEKCSVCRRTAVTAIKELKEVGLIVVENRWQEKRMTSNCYTVKSSPSAVDAELSGAGVAPPQEDGAPSNVSHAPSLMQGMHPHSATNANKGIPSYGHPILMDYPSYQLISDANFANDINKGKVFNENNIYNNYKDIIKNNIEYATLTENPENTDIINNLVLIMTDVVTSQKEKIRVAGEDRPTEYVRDIFLSLGGTHIEYVIKTLKNTTNEIKNINAYLVTTLFNSYKTIDAYYLNDGNSGQCFSR